MKEYKLPEVLRELLKVNKMTQQQLADKIYTTQSVIFTWLNRGTMPTLDSLMRLQEAFSVSIDYLVYGEEQC